MGRRTPNDLFNKMNKCRPEWISSTFAQILQLMITALTESLQTFGQF